MALKFDRCVHDPPLIEVPLSNAMSTFSSLTSRDVGIIDNIVRRVPTGTRLLTMLNAYEVVLWEHGIDAECDVRYFRIILKLALVKGPNWGIKWKSVKELLRPQTTMVKHQLPCRPAVCNSLNHSYQPDEDSVAHEVPLTVTASQKAGSLISRFLRRYFCRWADALRGLNVCGIEQQ